jgi:membrane protease YdiL (CAAX protease family)
MVLIPALNDKDLHITGTFERTEQERESLMRAQTLTTQPAAPSALKRVIIRHPLIIYFGLAFGISWLFLIADALGSHGLIPFRLTLSGPGILLVLLMGYGPTIAALIVTWATEGRAGIRALLARLLAGRAGPSWYVLALVGPAVLGLATGALQQLLGATLPPLPGPAYQVALMGVVGSLIHAIANGEELGWRGYALPRLLARHNALSASLILGVIWCAFHVPIMFTVGGVGGSQSLANALPFLVSTLALSVITTWMFNATGGSVLPIILLHGALNTWLDLFTTQSSSPAVVWAGVALLVLLAVIIVLLFGPEHLARKPAGDLPVKSDDVMP